MEKYIKTRKDKKVNEIVLHQRDRQGVSKKILVKKTPNTYDLKVNNAQKGESFWPRVAFVKAKTD